jgi:hypothetical protein
LQNDALWDHNRNVSQCPLELNLSQDLTRRRVNRRHSVASLSNSYSSENFTNVNQAPGYSQGNGNSSEESQKGALLVEKARSGSYPDIDNSENYFNGYPWCHEQELGKNYVHSRSIREPQSGRDSSARTRRRASCGVISESVPNKNLVGQSDEGLLNLISALKRDINPQKLNGPAKIPEKSKAEFRNQIPIARDSSSLLISNQNLLSGSQLDVRNAPLEHSGNHVAIHLPDSGAYPVTLRQESVKASFKDTHISLVYSQDFSVSDSLDDALKCAQSGLGTNFTTDSYKSEKKPNLVNSEGQTKVKSQGHSEVKPEDNSSTINEESETEENRTQSKKSAQSRTNFEQNQEGSAQNKCDENRTFESCSKSDLEEVISEKGLTQNNGPSPGQENNHRKHRPSPQRENYQIEVDTAEGVNNAGEHEVNRTHLGNSETSVKSSQGIDDFSSTGVGDCDSVVQKHETDEEVCVTVRHREDLGSEKRSVQNDVRRGGSRNNFGKVQDPVYLESGPRNTHFDKRPVTFELRSTAPKSGLGRPRYYSLDSGTRGLLRQEEESSLGSDSSDCEPSSLDSDSSKESVKEDKHFKESSPKEDKSKKDSLFSKLKHSLTAPEGFLTRFKKTLRKNHRHSTSSDIYTIREETSPDGVSVLQGEKRNKKLRKEERPKSLDETELDDAFKTFAEKSKQRQELRERSSVVPQSSEEGPESSVISKKEISLLRRKSLYDAPGIFDKFVSIVEAGGEVQSQESVLSGGTTTTNDSVFDGEKSNDISSTEETNDESDDDLEYDNEENGHIFNRFSLLRTSVRRASIDFGCLDQIKRNRKGKVSENISVSASLSDHNLRGLSGNLHPRCSDEQIMGYAMAQNQSSHNSLQTKMVADVGNNHDTTRDYLKEYRSKFGRLLPEQDSDQSDSKMLDGKSTIKSDPDSSGPSVVDAPTPSRTAQALANPSIRRFLLQSQARPSSNPVSRSSSPGTPDSGPHSPKVKSLLSNTEFFFSSSENSPSDSPRGSVSEHGSNSLRSSLRKDTDGAGGGVKSRLQRRSSSEMNLAQIGFMQQGKVESLKSGRSHTDPFPERSRPPQEILELSQRLFSDAPENAQDKLVKCHLASRFQDIVKRSSLKSKFHIPTFEEFKMKKKTTFSRTLDYIGQSGVNQSKSSSHQPIKGVHSILLVEQVRHARSMTALHELDKESDEDDGQIEGASSIKVNSSSGANVSSANANPLEQIASAVHNSGCGTLNDGGVLKAPPRRRHRSSDSRKGVDGLEDSLPRRPKSVHVDSAIDLEGGLDLRRAGSEQMLGFESSYDGAESRRVHHKTPGMNEGSISIPGVTLTESDLDICARPTKPEKRPRKKSRSMIELSKMDLVALERSPQGHPALQTHDMCECSSSERSRSKYHSHRLSSEHDLDKGQGHSEKHRRHKSGEKLTKSKFEPVPVDFTDGPRRSKSEKSRRVKELRGKRHQTDTGIPVGDFVDSPQGGVDIHSSSNRNSPHLRIETSANYNSASPVQSPCDDGERVSPRARRKNQLKKSETYKSSAKSSENITDQDLRSESMCKKLLKAQSMDNLNVRKKIHRHDKHEKVKGQRPVSVCVPVDIDVGDGAFAQEMAPPQKSDHQHQLSVTNDTENKVRK